MAFPRNILRKRMRYTYAVSCFPPILSRRFLYEFTPCPLAYSYFPVGSGNSFCPTFRPTFLPTVRPAIRPTIRPTARPTIFPTFRASFFPQTTERLLRSRLSSNSPMWLGFFQDAGTRMREHLQESSGASFNKICCFTVSASCCFSSDLIWEFVDCSACR